MQQPLSNQSAALVGRVSKWSEALSTVFKLTKPHNSILFEYLINALVVHLFSSFVSQQFPFQNHMLTSIRPTVGEYNYG